MIYTSRNLKTDSYGYDHRKADLVVDDDIRVNISIVNQTQSFTGFAYRIHSCYHDSVLLDDAELQNDCSEDVVPCVFMKK